MKLGVIARADDRGIGIQTWEAVRALQPERVLVVDMGELARGFPMHLDRFSGATLVRYQQGELDEQTVRGWLDGLDAVLAVETLYDWRLPQWAKQARCATVVQVNPEFMHDPGELASVPTAWWAPTPWRLNRLPEGTDVVAVPVADDRFAFAVPERRDDDPLRVLHVAGHRAMADRNGTNIVFDAVRHFRAPAQLTIVTQDARLPSRPRATRAGVEVQIVTGGVKDYWRLYDGFDVLLLPRRYGGLCLPAQEAMAAGLAVVMSDAEPQRSIWPIVPVMTATSSPKLRCPGGPLPVHNARPEAVARVINELNADRDVLAMHRRRSVEWAMTQRWSVMRPTYDAKLEAVAAAR